jgi:uncharacterized membrane protein
VAPFLAIPAELVTSPILHDADAWLGWKFLGLGTQGAQAMLQTIVNASLSFAVFTFGFMLVAIQVASGQLTPRIIATTLLRDNVVRGAVSLYIFSLMFAVSALNRMESTPHQLVLLVAASLGILCFTAFLYVIDYAARLLRPISVLSKVGHDGLAVIASVYPDDSSGTQHDEPGPKLERPDRVVLHSGSSEIVVAVNIDALKAEAERSNGVIELVPQIGDFVAVDEPLFHLYGGTKATDDDTLRAAIVFGPERTMEQDPAFAFRVIIDIALRALSSAINDPTTAVLAIDQLHRLLRSVGKRHLRTDFISDSTGQLRLVLRTPNWEDFVNLAFTEIRSCGSQNIQVARRLQGMIENLVQTLPDYRHAALREQQDLLNRDIEQKYNFKEDVALALIPDSQGLGGHSGKAFTGASRGS